MRKRIVAAQLGGPTAVINSTLVGLYTSVHKYGWELYGSISGMHGLSEGIFMEISDSVLNSRYLPGAMLKSGRTEASPERIEKCLEKLMEFHADAVVLIGGNGTMWVAGQLNSLCTDRGLPLSIIGAPKTVDNDIQGIDHSPGFPSAAKFVSYAVADIRLDLRSMQGFEHVRVIEAMGRNVGWLTATGAFFDDSARSTILLLPERPFDLRKCIARVQENVREDGMATIVIGEGAKSTCGTITGGIMLGESGPMVPGRVAGKLAKILRQETGLVVRDETLGILQRCSRLGSSSLDYDEACKVGEFAGELLHRGMSGVMVALERIEDTDYHVGYTITALGNVAGMERCMPLSLINDDFGVDRSYYDWLEPLIK
ncbi:diphosphate--fructose-6-phosphate 1-phosphotransferase [Alicyclobacillus dauci]|uniref:Diphosphate--fructose-6-phosphate 1-phosphotransferase n=1 Tax=Alicyclobacillus dauci TaxID=1475485 RepID=A0ABY6YXD9_9BACL|nr:diphosphate--fructose-6-phosphate 1-phosphotransferase [Alicyclobacillus dauci]WAH35192.1 diphosphate--fructose-6-phosphate 1-phosphotransferase [Alicyclobacillus dauci]